MSVDKDIMCQDIILEQFEFYFQGKQGEPGPQGNSGLRGLPVSNLQ